MNGIAILAASILAVAAEHDDRPIPVVWGPLSSGAEYGDKEIAKRNLSGTIAYKLDLCSGASVGFTSPELYRSIGPVRNVKLIGPCRKIHRLKIAFAIGFSEQGPAWVISTIDHTNYHMVGNQ